MVRSRKVSEHKIKISPLVIFTMVYETLLALLPFALLFVLIVGLRFSTLKSAIFVWLLTVLILLFVWKVGFNLVEAAFVKSIFLGLEIMLIIFMAVWLLELLQASGDFAILKTFLVNISHDARVQVILIGFLFGSLIEGIAGFGTPAAIVAPILVSLGFSPLLAVVSALIANSTAVSFGAAGTPILLGLNGLGLNRAILTEIAKTTALIHLVSFIVPLTLVFFVVRQEKEGKRARRFFEALPFTLFAWLSFILPYFLITKYTGIIELPSIFAGLVGIFVVGIAAKKGFLIPKNKFILDSDVKHHRKWEFKSRRILLSMSPYILIVLFLLLTRLIRSWKIAFVGVDLSWNNILGTNLSHSFLPLYTPSFYFLTGILFTLVFLRPRKKAIRESFIRALSRVKLPLIVLIFILAIVQVLLFSGENSSGLESMPVILAKSLVDFGGDAYVFLSPFIGVFGAFITGSNTVANILFGGLQMESAVGLGLDVAIILALQIAGGAIGNMIAIHNVLTANASVGLKKKEGDVIRRTILICLIYALLAGIVGWILLD